jgi:hypothetical protein
MIALWRLKSAGVEAFRAYLYQLRNDPGARIPVELLNDSELAEPLAPAITATVRAFATRLEFAQWLHEAADQSGTEVPRGDVGFWAWMSLLLFDQVCPADASGHRRPGADARHILEVSNWRRRYRHLLATPYNVLQLHRDDPSRAAVILSNPLDKAGELSEQLSSRIDLVTCPGTMALATRLFIDPASGRRRRGASGEAARRLGKLLNQYSRTWDLPSADVSEFAAVLPEEFARFREAGR